MEYQKITNLLDTTSDDVPRFITKKWLDVYDQSGSAEDRYKPSKQIRFKTSMLRSDLCDFSDAYIVVKGDITLTKTNGRGIIDIRNRFLPSRQILVPRTSRGRPSPTSPGRPLKFLFGRSGDVPI